MDQQRNADVVVPILCADLAIVGRVRRILDLSGPALRRLLLIDDGCPDGDLEDALAELAADPRIERIHGSAVEGWVELCNLGLGARSADAVIVTTETDVTDGWLLALAEAAHSEERAALAAAVEVAFDAGGNREAELRQAVEGLPRWTSTPRAGRACNYLRGEALDAVGLLDPTFKTLSGALEDWLMRASAVGFFAKRANHAFVRLDGAGGPGAESAAEWADREVLNGRHPQFADQVRRFDLTLDGSLTRHAIELKTTGSLRVALDLRHLPMEQNGTRMYAISLGKALAALPEIDLTLIATHPIQADGIPGRIVSPADWADDVAVVHKPAQIFDRRHAELLFQSRAHVFITYQDLIAYRMPGVFTTEDGYNAYRNTSRLTLQAAQGILAYSECTAREIADEFALPIDEVSPISLGVDVDSFGAPVAEAEQIKIRLGLPARYFLSLAGDYPHKNTASLLEAYAELRRDWRDDEPPSLVLAGNAPVMAARVHDLPGVHCLGVVSAEELRVLYQSAEALVFPSLYEGFGLPPLEAMAAGAAVVAMPFSSVPEVCGDAALYCDGLKHVDLSRAMTRLAGDSDLRAELISRGLRRIETLRWQFTARATYGAYRKAVLRPSPRSLRMRQFLNEAIVRWSQPPIVEVVTPEPPPVAVPVAPEPPPVDEFVAPESPPALEPVAPEPPPVVEFVAPESPPAVEPVALEPTPLLEIITSEPTPLLEIVAPEPLPAVEGLPPESTPELETVASEPLRAVEVMLPESPPVVEIVAPEPTPVDEIVASPTMEDELAPALELGGQEPVPGFAESETRTDTIPAEPMGVINACCALREALGRRVRRDVGHLKDVQRIRILRARRLSRRFIEVVRSDGLGAACQKAKRKLAGRMRQASTPG